MRHMARLPDITATVLLGRWDAIGGIQIFSSKQQQSTVSQYADETTLILANDYYITQCFHIVNIFAKGSGGHPSKY